MRVCISAWLNAGALIGTIWRSHALLVASSYARSRASTSSRDGAPLISAARLEGNVDSLDGGII
jgi:hypothetical protein